MKKLNKSDLMMWLHENFDGEIVPLELGSQFADKTYYTYIRVEYMGRVQKIEIAVSEDGVEIAVREMLPDYDEIYSTDTFFRSDLEGVRYEDGKDGE